VRLTSDCAIGLSCGTVGTCENLPPPAPMTMPTSLAFSFVQGTVAPPPQRLGIYNAGGGTLSFSIHGAADHRLVDAVPEERLIPAGGQPVGVNVSLVLESTWPVGTHEDSITISAAGVYAWVVPITVTVTPP
jgi:hypothetical protein